MSKAALALLLVMSVVLSSYAQAEPKSGVSILGLEDEEDIFPDDEGLEFEGEQTRNNLGSIGAVLLALKGQFKEILQEIGLQIFSYVKDMLHHFRIKLLKKLGLYTLKDVFHVVFDGVTDFVVDSTPEVVYKEIPKPVAEPLIDERFSLASLFKSSRR